MFGKKKGDATAADGFVSGLFGNSMIAKVAFSKAKDWFKKDGITAVVVRMDETAVETDGIRLEAFKSGVLILSGDDAVRLRRPIQILLSMSDEDIQKMF